MHIVLGFKSPSSQVEGVVLYAGKCGKEARKILNDPEKGFVRTEIYSHPLPSSRKFHKVTAKPQVESTDPAEVIAEPKRKRPPKKD